MWHLPVVDTFTRLARSIRFRAGRRYSRHIAPSVRPWLLARAIKKLQRTAPELPSAALLNRARNVWRENPEEAAPAALMRDAIAHAGSRPDAVLECGSGLSTLILGIYADALGFEVYALEHHEGWGRQIEGLLRDYGVTSARVLLAPLGDHDGLEWYLIPPEVKGLSFGTVVCDGPPAGKFGRAKARYPLLPVMRDQLAPDALILLDDAERPGEQWVLGRWADDHGAWVHMVDAGTKQYAQVLLP